MIWDEFLRHFRFCDEEDSGLSDEAKKNFLEKFKTASQFLKKQLRMSWPNPFQQHSKVFRYATVQDYEHYSY